MIYCRSCLQPNTRPNTMFDDEGVCPACRYFKTLADVDWDERRAELDAILKDFGSRQRNGYDCIIGVSGGEFSMAMNTLHPSGLCGHLRETIAREDKPVLGICLGLQLFAAYSEESPGVEGLALLEGSVKRLPLKDGRVPYTGWSQVAATNGSDIDGCYYFSHSFYFDSPEDQVIARTTGSRRFPACLRWKNIFGCQFHPEKGQSCGEKFFAWFLKVVRDGKKFG